MANVQDAIDRAVTSGAISQPVFAEVFKQTGLPLVFARMDIWNKRLLSSLQDAMRDWAKRVESEMQTGARWQDRTGHARQALRAYLYGDDPRKPGFADSEPPKIKAGKDENVVIVTGLMSYNFWLEVKDAGRYAIIWPTVVRNNAEYMKTLVRYGKRVT